VTALRGYKRGEASLKAQSRFFTIQFYPHIRENAIAEESINGACIYIGDRSCYNDRYSKRVLLHFPSLENTKVEDYARC
jgi:hypothetical protein